MAPKAAGEKPIPPSGISESVRSVPITAHPPAHRDSKVSIVRHSSAPKKERPPPAPVQQHRLVMPPSASYTAIRNDPSTVVVGGTARRIGVDCYSCCVTGLCCLLLVALCVMTAAVWRLAQNA